MSEERGTFQFSLFERLTRNEASIEFELCLSDVTALLVRLAFARSRKYLRGFRSLNEQVKILESSDYSIYQLALQLSQRERVEETIRDIRRLL